MTRTHKKNNGSFVLAVVLILVLTAVFLVKLKSNNTTVENQVDQFYNNQLASVEIFESLDANAGNPRFKLHAQSKNSMSAVPEKILLIEKSTKNIQSELTLTKSQNEEECLPHSHMPTHTMPKWDTDWFSIDQIPASSINNEYSSKLADTYSILLLYKDGSSEQLSSSVHEISNVCYHVANAIPMTPVPRIEN